MNTTTIRPITAFPNPPDAKGALSGTELELPKSSSVEILAELDLQPRFGRRFLFRATIPVGPFRYAYAGRDDLKQVPPAK